MRRRQPLLALLPLLLAAACAPPATPAGPAPDRILAIDADGNAIRRSTVGEHSRAEFAHPIEKVWSAMILTYAELGIEPTVADRALGRYGNGGFLAPRRLAGRPLGEYFNCGSGMTGPYIDQGRLVADVVTTLQAAPGGGTSASTHALGTLRRNDGASADPIVCASTGALEERLRTGIEARLAAR